MLCYYSKISKDFVKTKSRPGHEPKYGVMLSDIRDIKYIVKNEEQVIIHNAFEIFFEKIKLIKFDQECDNINIARIDIEDISRSSSLSPPKIRNKSITISVNYQQGQYVAATELYSWVFICDTQKQRAIWQENMESQIRTNEVLFSQTFGLLEYCEINDNQQSVDEYLKTSYFKRVDTINITDNQQINNNQFQNESNIDQIEDECKDHDHEEEFDIFAGKNICECDHQEIVKNEAEDDRKSIKSPIRRKNIAIKFFSEQQEPQNEFPLDDFTNNTTNIDQTSQYIFQKTLNFRNPYLKRTFKNQSPLIKTKKRAQTGIFKALSINTTQKNQENEKNHQQQFKNNKQLNFDLQHICLLQQLKIKEQSIIDKLKIYVFLRLKFYFYFSAKCKQI